MQISDYGIMNNKAVVTFALTEWSNTIYPPFLAESKIGGKYEIFFFSQAKPSLQSVMESFEKEQLGPTSWKEDNEK